MPIISIIVPVYNVEKYLHRCVDSILNQTFRDFELILIDDGSTDNSGKICDEYSLLDNRIIVKHIPNGGVSNARNVALSIVSGEYISFCDSDDYYNNEMLNEMYTSINQQKTDLISCNYYTINDSETLKNSSYCQNNLIILNNSQKKLNYLITNFLAGKHGWEIWHHLFRADIIKNNNIKFLLTCNNFAEDLAFVFEYLLYTNSIFMLNKSLYYYYLRNDSMMRKSEAIIKLNELNEVAYELEDKFKCVFNKKEAELYGLISFLILNTQYSKIISKGYYKTLPSEINKITNQKWYKKQLFKILKHSKTFNNYFSKSVVQRIILFTTYCIHRNWKLYNLCSGIYYKFIYKED